MAYYVYVATSNNLYPKAVYRQMYEDAINDKCFCVYNPEYLEHEEKMVEKIRERDVAWVAKNTIFNGDRVLVECSRCSAMNVLWNKLQEKEEQ